ncbi:MAG: type II secretion system F family protein [Phycisphaerae bacterium]|jgi:type II secretory pathway component PulF
MAVFEYSAIDSAGAQKSGRMNAENRKSASLQLEALHLMPFEIKEVERHEQNIRGGMSKTDVETYTRELGCLLSSGMPLSKALNVLVNEADKPLSKRLWREVSDNVSNGATLADSLRLWPKYFPPVYSAMVQAGETGGFLDLVLNQIADFRSNENELKGRVHSAMIYPIALSVFCFFVFVFMMLFFIPRFSLMFEEFGGQLPVLTRGIIAVSDILYKYGIVVIILMVAGVIFFRKWLESDAGKLAWEMKLLKMPIVGSIMAKFAFVRFTRMLGTLIGSGVPLIEALKVAREAIGNHVLSGAVSGAVDDVQRGHSLSQSLRKCPQLFNGANIEMLAVAEESSLLDKELVRLADINERQLDRKLKTAVSYSEPLMLFIVAAVIGTIVVGMLLPIFNLQELIH